MTKYILLLFLSACVITHDKNMFKNSTSENYFKLAKQYELRGDLDSALIFYNLADSFGPGSSIILHDRGLLKSNMGYHQEAIIDITHSIELLNRKKDIMIQTANRGLIYYRQGNLTAACDDWAQSGKYGKKYLQLYCIQ